MHQNPCTKNKNKKTRSIALFFAIPATIITALLLTITASPIQTLALTSKQLTPYPSSPSAIATHEAKFTTEDPLPPLSRITIELAQEVTSSPPIGLTDSEVYLDDVAQTTTAAPGASTFGVINTGPDAIQITTPSALTIASGTEFTVKLGTQDNLTNPPEAGSYPVTFEIVNSGGTPIDSGSALFAIINAVTSTAYIADPNAPPTPPGGGSEGGEGGTGRGIPTPPPPTPPEPEYPPIPITPQPIKPAPITLYRPPAPSTACLLDPNGDQIINLLDATILSYGYGSTEANRLIDFYSDGIINTQDLSYLVSCWSDKYLQRAESPVPTGPNHKEDYAGIYMLADDKGTGLLKYQNQYSESPIQKNGIFSIYLLIDTGEESINAADIQLEYSTDIIELENIRYDSSRFTVWHNIPLPEENELGIITFKGATPDAFKGSQGMLMEMQFSRVASGNFSIKFKGTQGVFHRFGEPSPVSTTDLYEAIREIPETIQTKTPPTKLTSPSHPNQKQWVSNNKVKIDWSKDINHQRGDKYNYTVSQQPQLPPNDNTTKDTKLHFTVPNDGQWYISVQRERDGIKGPTTTYGFKVDTNPPEPFVANLGQKTENNGDITNFLAFTTIDLTSGMAHYKVCRGTTCNLLNQSPFTTDQKTPGFYKYTVQAIDRAGNIQESQATLNIPGSNYYTIKFPVNIYIYILPILGLLLLLILLAWGIEKKYKHYKKYHKQAKA